ncbi:TIGR04222 domain-containing membrane protein [Bradyrhizobium sp.]|uniref:TIGR04222 domain-containing membrane protein n=1 Tax=Bradyrhizobium sp. TaxID=376 RepID=UPI0040376C58
MDWLTHNPIADLPGPQFLLVYGATAVAVIAATYGLIRLLDRTDWRKPPRVPGTFDPYEMAYLCGGKNAVIRTVLYAVYRRGLVLCPPVSWFRASRIVTKADLSGRTLTGLEERVLKAIRRPSVPSRLFRDEMLARDVERLCKPFRINLRSERLLRSGILRAVIGLVPLVATATLVSPVAYKAVVAAPKGRPDVLLMFITSVALVILWSLVGPLARMRGLSGHLSIPAMNTGTIPSPWHYGAVVRHALQSAKLRRPAIVYRASWATVFSDLASRFRYAKGGLHPQAIAGGRMCMVRSEYTHSNQSPANAHQYRYR